jgi:hypothetical protein
MYVPLADESVAWGELVAVSTGDASIVSPFASRDDACDGEFGLFVFLQVGLALGQC